MVNSLLIFFDRVSLWFIFPIEYKIIIVEIQVCSRQFLKNKNGSGFFHQKSFLSYNGGLHSVDSEIYITRHLKAYNFVVYSM